MSKALVLGGGSIKGAFQAGAIAGVLEKGHTFDAIYGVSVGALNGAWVTARVGKARAEGFEPDWKQVGRELVQLWKAKINRPDSLGDIYDIATLAGSVRWSKWKGLMNINKLAQIMQDEVKGEWVKKSGIDLHVGCTDVHSGEYVESTLPLHRQEFLQYIFASAVTPIVMPTVDIGGRVLTDGGLRHIVPVAEAIRDGHDEIIAIACQQAPEDIRFDKISVGSLPNMIFRAFDIMSSAVVEADLAPLKRNPAHTIIRPKGRIQPDLPTPLEALHDIMDFTEEQLDALLEYGREMAERVLDGVIV